MRRTSYVLLLLCAHYSRCATPDKRDLDGSIASHSVEETALEAADLAGETFASDIGSDSSIFASNIPIRHTVAEFHTNVAIPVPQAIPISVPRAVPYPVHVGVPVDHPRPVPIPIPHPVAYIVPRPFAVPVDRPFPYPVAHPVPVTITQGVQIPVPQPYHVSIPSAVPVRVPLGVPVGVSLGGYRQGLNGGLIGSGYANAVGIGSGFVSSGISSTQPIQYPSSGTGVSGHAHGHEIEHPY